MLLQNTRMIDLNSHGTSQSVWCYGGRVVVVSGSGPAPTGRCVLGGEGVCDEHEVLGSTRRVLDLR
jgi:hypothetical protein